MPVQIANPQVIEKIERLSRLTGLGNTATVEGGGGSHAERVGSGRRLSISGRVLMPSLPSCTAFRLVQTASKPSSMMIWGCRNEVRLHRGGHIGSNGDRAERAGPSDVPGSTEKRPPCGYQHGFRNRSADGGLWTIGSTCRRST